MIGQLQSMIDSIATQAAPVVRQVGAKAAELAAVAADRAGPLAHRAADATADASVKIAERSRTLAADLRSRATGANGNDDPRRPPAARASRSTAPTTRSSDLRRTIRPRARASSHWPFERGSVDLGRAAATAADILTRHERPTDRPPR